MKIETGYIALLKRKDEKLNGLHKAMGFDESGNVILFLTKKDSDDKINGYNENFKTRKVTVIIHD